MTDTRWSRAPDLTLPPWSSAVFIKYNSASGDAFLSGYAGDARGVLFTPGLPDGVFRREPGSHHN